MPREHVRFGRLTHPTFYCDNDFMTSRVIFCVWAPAFGTDLRSALPMIRKAGFTGIQLDAAATKMLDLVSLSSSGRREVKHLVEANNLQLASIRIDLGANGLGIASDVDRLLDRVDSIINVSAELACPVVCVDLGRLPPAQRLAKPRPQVTKQMAGVLILPEVSTPIEPEPPVMPTRIDPAISAHWQQALAQLGEIADRYGQVLALSSSLSSVASLESLLKQVECPWFGVDLDTSMILKDAMSLDETFDVLGERIRHVRARDATQGEDRRTKPAIVGKGDVPWRDVLGALDGSGFSAAMTLDPAELNDPQAGAIAGLKLLQAYLET